MARQQGIKPIIGCEVYVAPGSRHDRGAGEQKSKGAGEQGSKGAEEPGKNHLAAQSPSPPGSKSGISEASFHLTLLAKDLTGYRNLLVLVSKGYQEGFYYRPRIDKELLSQHAQGLIALSGCLKGEIDQLLLQGQKEKAASVAAYYQEVMGEGDFYLEIQDQGLEEQRRIQADLLELSQRIGVPLVATNDCHYLKREDAKAHEVLLAIQTGKTIKESSRLKFSSDQFYFRSPDEMAQLFREVPQAVTRTREIADRCNLELTFGEMHLPQYQVPAGHSLESYLEELATRGLEERLHSRKTAADSPLPEEHYWERLRYELGVILQMGYAGYFLIVWDFIHYARRQGIPVGPGRGSAAGSLVAYALKITDLDPLKYQLLFERFLNPERVTLPDIDIDFCMERRDEVIDYVVQKYGSDNVTQIITFGTMMAKGVIRDVGRCLDVPYGEVDKIAKLVPARLNITLEEALQEEPRLRELREKDEQVSLLLETAQVLEGLPRHASTHAAGVVIAPRPLTEYLPLFKGSKGEVTTQYAMDDLELLGLLKMDFLGLRTLTVIQSALRMIQPPKGELEIENCKLQIENLPSPVSNLPPALPERSSGQPSSGDLEDERGKRESADFQFSIFNLQSSILLEEIPLDDAATYELLGQARTMGVFQLESRGMREILKKLKPQSFEDVVALVALYRPGPLGSGMVDDFIQRKHGKIPIQYELPELEGILKDTYGVILYQEQVMQIASALAGFSLGAADVLRRAMGKKKADVMAQQRTQFVQGAVAHGFPKEKAEKIFDQMEYFAGYGFNRSHSAAYGLIAYQTAYLKAHYPAQYMAALLTSEADNTDKVMLYLRECREMGIQVLPPDIQRGARDFTLSKEGLRFGLAAVKNVGQGAIEAIIAAREAGGDFQSLEELCQRIDSRAVNRRVLESLIKAGACDSLGESRARMVTQLEQCWGTGQKKKKEQASGQMTLFAPKSDGPKPRGRASAEAPPEPKPPAEWGAEARGGDWDRKDLLRYEKEVLGFYLSGHPLDPYEKELNRYSNATTQSCTAVNHGKEVRLAGTAARVKVQLTKKGEPMAIVTLEDLYGSLEVVVYPNLFKEVQAQLEGDEPLMVQGKLRANEDRISLIAEKIFLLASLPRLKYSKVHLRLPAAEVNRDTLTALRDIALVYPGACDLCLHFFFSNEKQVSLEASSSLRVSPDEAFLSRVEALIGSDVVFLE
ncbi:MAG: DNA polymerase III subunit alpha [Nitrospinae bacterium]|nr:DNA polymerase III subunit alpha [Nitrospinota bacterium]